MITVLLSEDINMVPLAELSGFSVCCNKTCVLSKEQHADSAKRGFALCNCAAIKQKYFARIFPINVTSPSIKSWCSRAVELINTLLKSSYFIKVEFVTKQHFSEVLECCKCFPNVGKHFVW